MRRLLFRTAAGLVGVLFLVVALVADNTPLTTRIAMPIIGVTFILYAVVGNDRAERWLNLFVHIRPTEIVDPTRKPHGPNP